jgi:putative phosphoesterase
MKVAALYDIHGNLPALNAVLEDIRQADIDLIIVGGDVVLGPMSGECLDRLQALALPVQYIKGNCEAEVISKMKGMPNSSLPETVLKNIAWTADQLSPAHLEFIDSWPEQLSLNILGVGEVLFCHATPRSLTEVFTRLSPKSKLDELFGSVQENVIICGHTHMQFQLNLNGKRVVNAGSVGMPFAPPGAYWLSLGPIVRHQHTTYDFNEAAKIISTTNYPEAKQFAESNILNPPSEKRMLSLLNRQEQK